jgi:hypothetical protein
VVDLPIDEAAEHAASDVRLAHGHPADFSIRTERQGNADLELIAFARSDALHRFGRIPDLSAAAD